MSLKGVDLEGVDITLNIQNNRDYSQQINVMGNPSNLLDTANATREFRWDVTTFSFVNEDNVTIQYKSNNAASYSTFTAILPSNTIQGLVYALNGLNIGYFNAYTELGAIYVGTYNQNYIFGDLNIFSSTAPSQGLNTSFVVGAGFSPTNEYSLNVSSSGDIFVGGQLTSFNGTAINNIAKLNSAGTLNTPFNTNVIAVLDSTEFAESIALQNDGKIYLGTVNGLTTNNSILRLNADGTKDLTFITGTNFNNWVYAVMLQTDGKILVGGLFSSYNGNSCKGLARLNTDGSFNATLNIGTGFNDSISGTSAVQSVAIQTDGKIVVGGYFNSFNGSPAFGIIRLNANGSVDGTFTSGTGFGYNSIWDIAIQSDGKILIGGTFTSYNGASANYIVRLNPNGTIDNTFNIGTAFNNTVFSIVIQPNGQILVGGDFTTYKGVSYLGIIRLNTDGSVDTSWSIGGFNNTVYNMKLSNNTIYVAGTFTSFNGITVNSMANLYI